jgi:hypothetical protein
MDRSAALRAITILLGTVVLLGAFSAEITDTDFWWHLRTGQYICDTHSLPDPDPFSYTTNGWEPVRHFNLTHEWLAQVLLFAVYRAGGFGTVVLLRALLLAKFCGLVGWIVYRRTGGFYRAVAASMAAATVVHPFVADRPYLLTFVCVAAAVWILDRGNRTLWLLPPLMLIWANCHGGFILGWVAMGAWCVEALWQRKRDWKLWAICAASIAVSGVNPNGFGVIPALLHYRESALTSAIAEWKPPALWPPTAFSVLLVLAGIVLIWRRRDVPTADVVLYAAFAVAGLTAGRNTFLMGLASPVIIATYVPWKRAAGPALELAAAAAMGAGLVAVALTGPAFQLRVAQWAFPEGAANFLLTHHVTGRMFNTYEYGGYLIWRLWPREKVFIDGRAINESLVPDYNKLAYTNDYSGKSVGELLDRYGIEVIVANHFEHASGMMYTLAPVLTELDENPWQVVYTDAQSTVLMRHPQPEMQRQDPAALLASVQANCEIHLEHDPGLPGCARNLGQMFAHTGDRVSARRWLKEYLDRVPAPDPEAERLFQSVLQ